MKKRILAGFLTLCMALALLPSAAFAANSDFSIENGVLIKYTGSGGDVVIPDGVTSIGSGAFLACYSLTSVTIPSNVTSIGSSAFYGCISLTSVTIPNSVISIESGAFLDCRSLTSVIIPSSVTSIGSRAFSGCNELTEIKVSEDNSAYSDIDGVLFDKTGETLIALPGSRQGDYDIPAGVISIWEYAFCDCSELTGVTIPNSVTSIGNSAFEGCSSLTSVTIPNNVTSIENFTFSFCNSLASVTIPSSVTSIGYGAFEDCYSLTSVTIPNSVTSIEPYAFRNCSRLTEIKVSENNPAYSDIDGVLFDKTGETLIALPGSRQGHYDIPSGVTSIYQFAFSGCNELTSVTIPSSVTSIGRCAFENCNSLTSVTIPNSVTSIEYGAFRDCNSLTSVRIPNSITSIEMYAFDGCARLMDIYYLGTEADWSKVSIEQQSNEPLLNATIHFAITADVILDEDEMIEATVTWDDSWFNLPASEYNHELATTMSALSCAAYDEKNIKDALIAFGFDGDKIEQEYYNSKEIGVAGYTLASKPISTPDEDYMLVAVIVRGSSNLPNWVTDFLAAGSNHVGFQSAYLNVYLGLEMYISAQGYDNENLKFLVTGHSLGAAVSGLLANDLSSPPNSNNVFCYTFASPNTSKLTVARDNIFNIVSMCDVVTLVPFQQDGYQRHGVDKTLPDAIGDAFVQGQYSIPSYRSKKMMDLYKRLKGETYRPLSRYGADSIIAGGYSSILGNLLITEVRSRFFTTHSSLSYYCWMASCTEDELFGSFHSEEPTVTLSGKWGSIKCPVDVYVRDTSGVIIASVVDEEVAEPGLSISVRDGEKTFFMFNDQDYKIEIIAREKGTVSYEVEEITITGTDCSALRTITFEDIEIEKGDTLTGDIDAPFSIHAAEYALTKKSGDTIGVILPDSDSSGTISGFSVTFDPTGGSLTTETVAIGEDGKFAELPTASRNGYTFNGWYTAPSGGDKITTDTVFNSDTTAYAQWTYAGTSTSSNPSISSASTSSYSISIPSVTGGTVSVSPTSASVNSTVTITITPDNGYELAALTVTDANGKALELTNKGDGKYSFKMPNGKVLLSAEFRPMSADVIWDNPFVDVSTEGWYYDAVKFVSENGLMNGIGNGLFAPNANLSRAMLAQILYNKEGTPSISGENTFTDVQSSAWYADAVIWASTKGIVGGYGNGLFGPNDDITREQFVVMLYRYAGSPVPPNLLLDFSDASKVSDWAQDAVRWAVDQGILNGKGNGILDPTGKTTRAEAAQMLKNYLEK